MNDQALLDSIMAEAELEAGLPPEWVVANNPLAMVTSIVVARRSKVPRWTRAEEEFLRDNLGVLSLDEIAAALGRSRSAIKIRFTRYDFAAPSKRPGWLTGNQIARVLGVDIHSICNLIERGLLPAQRLPGERGILAIRQVTLYRWATNPDNWPYFIRSIRDPRRITDPHLRRLLERQKERWNDEWWSIGEVAIYHNVDHRDVNRYIHHGKALATNWHNWWIKRSEAIRLKFYKGKGAAARAQAGTGWTPAADAYILRARAEGIMWSEIARRMKRNQKAVTYRGSILKRKD